jgi:hypothetical protein
VVNLSAPPAAGTCTSQLEQWSSGDCKLERVFTCVNGALTGHYTIETQETQAGGAELSGTYGLQIDDASGPGCTGSYRITYTRQ